MNFRKNFATCTLQNFQKTLEFQLILLLMKDYEDKILEDLEQMEQV